MSEPAATVRAEDEPSWAEVVRRAEHGESVSVVAHGDHVADVVPSGELDRLRETTAVLSGRGMSAGAEAWTAARPGAREAESLAGDVPAAGEPVRRIAEEQAALRRVATLVAQGAAPEEVFAAVAAEVGRVLAADFTSMVRYDPDGTATWVAVWSRAGTALPFPVGTRWRPGGHNMHTLVFQTRRPVRINDYAGVSGPSVDLARSLARSMGLRSQVGVPVSVEDRLWGAMTIFSTRAEPLPADTEARLAAFTELAATAIANAEAKTALTASRARIVATADATRRRIERNLHDGAQQHLVALALQLRAARAAPPQAGELVRWLDEVAAGLDGVLEELRGIAHGLHPAILAQGGLRPALKMLARRSAVPVRLDVQVQGRLPDQIEIAAYYTVGEALTNIAKHAHASGADVEVAARDGLLHVRVHDDGCGGASLTGGSGLVGLKDRAEALGGRIDLHSPPGAGTAVHIVLPLGDPGRPGQPTESPAPPGEPGRAPAAHPGPPGPAPES